MKRTGIFSGIGLTAILLAFAGWHISSPKGTSEAAMAAPAIKPAVTNAKLPVKHANIEKTSQNRIEPIDLEAEAISKMPEHIQQAIKLSKSMKPMSERIDGIVQNSRESSALLIKQLEEMGRGDDFKYLRNKMDYFNTFYNTSVIGESESQKEDVRNTLRDNLAIRMTSWGLGQKRAEQLQTLRYNVTEGGNRVLSLEATVNDFIALSENTKFGLDDNGTECLFFSSSAVKQYREIVYGSGDDSLFNPYCAYRDKFVSSYDPYDKNLSYDKIELEQLIKEFHQ